MKKHLLSLLITISFILSACAGSPANPGGETSSTATSAPAQPTTAPAQPTATQATAAQPTATTAPASNSNEFVWLSYGRLTDNGKSVRVTLYGKKAAFDLTDGRGFQPDISHLVVGKVDPTKAELSAVAENAAKLALAMGVPMTFEAVNDGFQVGWFDGSYYMTPRDSMQFSQVSCIKMAEKKVFKHDTGPGTWSKACSSTTFWTLQVYSSISAMEDASGNDAGFVALTGDLRQAMTKTPDLGEKDYVVVSINFDGDVVFPFWK